MTEFWPYVLVTLGALIGVLFIPRKPREKPVAPPKPDTTAQRVVERHAAAEKEAIAEDLAGPSPEQALADRLNRRHK